MSAELPLFPLNTVLFPGAPLTLHIFEERYRAMIGHCLDQSIPFGVVCTRNTEDEAIPALPYTIGTVAQINASVRLEDGRYLIATIGQQRFAIQEFLYYDPYMVVLAKWLSEELAPITGRHTTDALRETYERYWKAVSIATGSASQVEQLPGDDVAMTYYLAHRMQVTNERKQHWLEVDYATRVREIATMLHAEMSLLPRPDTPLPPREGAWPWSWN